MKRYQCRIALIMMVVCMLGGSSTAQVAIIINKDVPVSSITIEKVRDLYNLHSNEIDGRKVKVLDLANDCPARSKFYAALGKSQSEFRKLWLKAKLTGNGVIPDILQSEDAVVQKVCDSKGTIGFVSLGKINPSVKVLLKID